MSKPGASKSQEPGSNLPICGQVKDEWAWPSRTPHTWFPGDLYKDVKAVSFVIVESWTLPDCPSPRDWINHDEFRQWKILHTMIFKIGECEPHTSMKINLKNTLLIHLVKNRSCTFMICVLFV